MTTVPLQVDPATLETAINNSWILLVSFLIFFMHAGFAMLEAGQVRSKNVANQLTKNLLTWSVGVTVFFLIGAGVDSLVGTGSFAFVPGGEASGWIGWLYGAVFAMTAATIVSGAVAGRAKLRAYVTYTFLLAAVIYPVVSGMAWYGTGLLGIDGAIGSAIGAPFDDFAGGTVVHAVGGVAGLTAAWILGPRIGRYNDDGSANVIPGHSMTFAVLGTLMLAFGWYGFNVGTSAILGGGSFLGAQLGRVAMTTTVAMACGAMGAGLASWLRTGKVDTLYVANGLLAGLVGITAIPHATSWWGAFVVGAIAGIQLPIVFEFVEKRLKIDDVCAVFPVHGSAGIIGTLLLPVVVAPSYLGGLGYGRVDMFLAQLAGVVVIMAWTVLSTGLVWGVFKALGQARVSPGHEREGLDISEHGVETYPEFEETGELGEGAAVSDGGEPCDARRSSSDRRSDGGVPVEDAEDGHLLTDGGVPMTDGGATEEGDIKLVMAYVRPDKLADVKQGLAEIGAPSLSVTQVSGRGSQPSKTGQWRGEEYVVDLHQKVKIECVVADVPAEDVVDAIEESARTGEPGDGKIFVLPVESAVQIRTGKTGTEAV